MELQFIGAAGTVTGSKTLLKKNDFRCLIDCGLYQGIKNYRERNWGAFPVSVRDLDAIILTHAHIDHSGYLPVLVKRGFHGPIYCTPGTRDLCNILLPDAAHLQEEDARYANRKGFSKHHPAEPLFTQEDALNTLKLMRVVPCNDTFHLHNGLVARFSPVGHIIGAAFVTIDDGKNKIVFSGDVGRMNDFLMRDPSPIREADYLILESTYGDRLHATVDTKSILADIINRICARGGTVLLPAFAVGRAQMALHMMAELHDEGKIPHVPIYLNSPMAIKATEVFTHHPHEHRLNAAQCQRLYKDVHFVESTEESKALTSRRGPMVVISASGMATGGRVLHHLRQVLPDNRSAVVFLGFQAPGTRGDALIKGISPIKIHGDYYPVKCEIHHLDSLSAHGDYAEIMSWLRHLERPPRMTFINHGEPCSADAMRMHLQDGLGWKACVPEYMQEFRLED